MKVIRSIKSMQKVSRDLRSSGHTIGLVPTMGFLHEGHLSLIRRAKKSTDFVITSIFVNPTQFGPSEDLVSYPRNERRDLKRIREADGDIVFMPRVEDMYPADFQTWVSVEKLTQVLEGAHRPTHFRGVTTVVAKLFNITAPDLAVFGMKDFQQAVVLRQMTRDLGWPLKMVIAPTVREADGLAMSSRNKYFDESQRSDAVCLYRALKTVQALARSGERSATKLRKEMKAAIRATCKTAAIDYIAFTDFGTLKNVTRVDKKTIVSLAVKLHGVRLIDNMKLL